MSPTIYDLARQHLDEVALRIGGQHLSVPSLSSSSMSIWDAIDALAVTSAPRFRGLCVPSRFPRELAPESFQAAIREIEAEVSRLDPSGVALAAFTDWRQRNLLSWGHYDDDIAGRPTWMVSMDSAGLGLNVYVEREDLSCRRCNPAQRCPQGRSVVTSHEGPFCLRHALSGFRRREVLRTWGAVFLKSVVVGGIGYLVWSLLWLGVHGTWQVIAHLDPTVLPFWNDLCSLGWSPGVRLRCKYGPLSLPGYLFNQYKTLIILTLVGTAIVVPIMIARERVLEYRRSRRQANKE
jgi:hypothetical protein